MFCPNCRAEFRPGFARCSDCGVTLVEILPPPNPLDTELNENERPDLARTRYFLAWFVPMCIYLILFFTVWIRPSLFENTYIAILLMCFMLFGNIGSFWMIYQAVRHEKRVGKYVFFRLCLLCLFGIPSFASRFERNFKANPMSFVKAFRVGRHSLTCFHGL